MKRVEGDAIGKVLEPIIEQLQQNKQNPNFEFPVVKIIDTSGMDWGPVKLIHGNIYCGPDGSPVRVEVEGAKDVSGARRIIPFCWEKHGDKHAKKLVSAPIQNVGSGEVHIRKIVLEEL